MELWQALIIVNCDSFLSGFFSLLCTLLNMLFTFCRTIITKRRFKNSFSTFCYDFFFILLLSLSCISFVSACCT